MGAPRRSVSLVVALTSLGTWACGRAEPRQRGTAPSASATNPAPRKDADVERALDELRREETALRARTDFATLPPSSRALGANPYALVAEPGSGGFVGILRGDARVVLLDDQLTEVASLTTALSPSALALAPGGHVFVAGPLERGIERFRVAEGTLRRAGVLPLPDAVALRALGADERSVLALDFGGDQLFAWSLANARAASPDARATHLTPTCEGPIRLALSPHYAAVACLFDHRLVVYARDAQGLPERIAASVKHDGPLWSVALLELGDELFVAAGGVEDHPLVRRDKVFGYVDSFVYVYSLRASASELTQRLATNVSELGVITPKAVALEGRDGSPVVFALGYGSDVAVELALGGAPRASASVPGCAALTVAAGRRFCANPLFDAWVELGATPRFHPARGPAPGDPSASDRLGEALFFTHLMAPDASSRGRLSRFTCETCHFEGGTDGRVHNSGRDDIRVSTRPLFGLFNDAPHFSRAHDRDLTSVCHNEFAVANRGNPVDPWFSLDPARFPWLAALGVGPAPLAPLALRRALLGFLARFSHEESPAAATHADPRRFTDGERRGAQAFRERCASCHAARLIAGEAASEVPFARWESLTLSSATPIVWARGDYQKTGVVPYVNARGTRIPSLRRLYTKRPYLTNGAAPTLASVLEQARFSSAGFSHAASADPGDAPLGASERASLLEFLRLL